SNGTFSVLNLRMLSGSSFQDSRVHILTTLNVGGTNCLLNSTYMDVSFIAYATFVPVAPAKISTLTLARDSILQDSGTIKLADGSRIIAGSPPQSTLIIEPGALLSSTNLAYVDGSPAGHLNVDNSGLIRVDGGTLRFDNGIDWSCNAGTGEFRAASTNSLILFASGFHADRGTTSLFTGPGTNRWPISGSIDGTAQVGTLDPSASGFSTGNLEIQASYSGLGIVHVVGSPAQTAVLNWINGTLSLVAINVDAGATVLISGGAGTSRQLSGCALNNSGICSVLSGDLDLAQGSVINNRAGGVFDLRADGTFFGSPPPTGGAVNNAGTFRKSSPGLTQFGTAGPSQGTDFNNTGLVDLLSGQLNLMGGISSGQFQTEAGAVLWFWGGTHTLTTGASFTGPGSVRLYQGASAPKWLVAGTISVAELELGSNGLVVGTTNPLANPITFGTLIMSANGTISNGTYAVRDGKMLDGSTLYGSTLNVISNLIVGGAHCTINGSTLKITNTAFATVAPVPPATAATLTLARGSVLQDFGRLLLNGNSSITSGSEPQSRVVIKPGAVLSSTNLASIGGSDEGSLIVDNSGLVRVDGGTLRFANEISWESSANAGEFRAAATNSLILFATEFEAEDGKTYLFTGPGTNRWSRNSSIDGTAQVGARDPNTQAFTPGNLEVLALCSGSGSVHVLGNAGQTALLNWGNGTLSISAINIDPNGMMLINGAAGTNHLLSGCTLNNRGFCAMAGGDLRFSNGAVINNLAGGTFDVLADGSFSGSPAPAGGAFNNSGAFRKSSPGTTQFGTILSPQGPDFNNVGFVDVANGQLNLLGGVSNGEFQTEAGAVLWFWGATHNLASGARFTGGGSVRLYQGIEAPQWLVNGSVSVNELELGTNGTIGGVGTLGVFGALYWTNGIIQGSGSLSIAPAAVLIIGTGGGKTLLQRTINNQGNIFLRDLATVACGVGATLNNLARGTLEIQTDAALSSISDASPIPVINNSGRFVKSAGTQTSLLAADLINSGTIELKAGTLQCQGSWKQIGGSITVDGGTVLGGVPLSIEGGNLTGTGTIQGTVFNGGVTSPGGSPGVLSVATGQDYQQQARGTLRIELGGYNPGTQYDQLVVGGNASLAGILELNLINGFTPQLGDRFQILTCGSETGQFSQTKAPGVTNAVWVTQYGGTNIWVVLAKPVEISQPVMSGGALSMSFNTMAGLTYVVQFADSLDATNWQTLVEFHGDGTNKSVSDPATNAQRFYRVSIQ
ncbi:MAG: hypothetical protein NT154_28430, partial [Verrucomicrobia bacterium]|nr:hypothetical protein [Verrucomicrobiota bacterium]